MQQHLIGLTIGTIASSLVISTPSFANPEQSNVELNSELSSELNLELNSELNSELDNNSLTEPTGEPASTTADLISPDMLAQEEPENETENEVPEIRVTVTDQLLQQPIFTPFRRQGTVQESTRPTYVITKEQIEAQGWRTVDEALRYLPGVFSDGTAGGELGSLSGQFIRGSNSAQVLILLDGRPLNDLGFFGAFDLSNFTTDMVEQIEVLPGGGSTLYGSSAIGGVINIITRTPEEEGIVLHPTVQFGSFGFNQQGLQLSGRRGDLSWLVGYNRIDSENNFSYRIGDDQFEYTDPTANATTFNIENDRDNADVLYNNVQVKVSNEFNDRHAITFSALYLDKNIGIPGGVPILVPGSAGGFNNLTPNFRQDTQEWLMDVTLSSRLGEGDNSILTTKLYLDALQYTDSNPGPGGLSDNDVKRFSLGFQSQHSWQLSDRDLITYGADFRQVNAVNKSFGVTNYDSNLTQGALFASYQRDFLSTVRGQVGVRQDFNSLADGAFTSPSVGISWDVTPLTTFRANYARSFRAPLISDLDGFGIFQNPNPDIEPERGHSFDIGFDQQLGDRGLLRFSYFLNDVDNLIAFEPGLFPAPGRSINIGRVKTTGVETSLNVQLYKNFFLLANYTWNNPEIKEGVNEGNEPLFRGADVFNVGLSYENRRGLFAGVFVRNVGDRFTSNANTEKLTGYTTVDLKARVPINDRWNVDASLNNLLDEAFQEYPGYPGIGRNFQIGIRGRL